MRIALLFGGGNHGKERGRICHTISAAHEPNSK
jgi:hypothetical protein